MMTSPGFFRIAPAIMPLIVWCKRSHSCLCDLGAAMRRTREAGPRAPRPIANARPLRPPRGGREARRGRLRGGLPGLRPSARAGRRVKLRRSGPSASEGGGLLFVAEAVAVARIRHPNVLQVYGADLGAGVEVGRSPPGDPLFALPLTSAPEASRPAAPTPAADLDLARCAPLPAPRPDKATSACGSGAGAGPGPGRRDAVERIAGRVDHSSPRRARSGSAASPSSTGSRARGSPPCGMAAVPRSRQRQLNPLKPRAATGGASREPQERRPGLVPGRSSSTRPRVRRRAGEEPAERRPPWSPSTRPAVGLWSVLRHDRRPAAAVAALEPVGEQALPLVCADVDCAPAIRVPPSRSELGSAARRAPFRRRRGGTRGPAGRSGVPRTPGHVRLPSLDAGVPSRVPMSLWLTWQSASRTRSLPSLDHRMLSST